MLPRSQEVAVPSNDTVQRVERIEQKAGRDVDVGPFNRASTRRASTVPFDKLFNTAFGGLLSQPSINGMPDVIIDFSKYIFGTPCVAIEVTPTPDYRVELLNPPNERLIARRPLQAGRRASAYKRCSYAGLTLPPQSLQGACIAAPLQALHSTFLHVLQTTPSYNTGTFPMVTAAPPPISILFNCRWHL